ncbi:gamma-tubulin complex component 2 homolog isoform X2 [Teleopsis dalmanni]|uniref:gamma-tubulin complex component 2 homolog isoform X2 n=1 Tax=Teleopsis dalmanni TaxID=139649 RepID=UPI0018CF6C42|nr:gamma-tubulin complex component 2 homolog isoform X2 [Teleopsis dalmanni]XP_037949109.1 gamma-tubulin complex component 2 homolog isoform X2 [Teleopsis dalmanni]
MDKIRNKMQTSTPLDAKKLIDYPKSNAVTHIKNRITEATSTPVNRLSHDNCVNASNMITPLPNPKANKTQKYNDFKTDLKWCLDTIQTISFQKYNIEAIPITSQESILLRDLIYVLTGMQGSYITMNYNGKVTNQFLNKFTVEYEISPQVHSTLQDITREILPLAKYYLCIHHYMELWSFSNSGQVMEALSEALRKLMHDYYLLLAQLESELDSGKLSLHKMLFYIRPTLNTMEILDSVITDIAMNNVRGGAVLTVLYNKIGALTGDEESQKFIIQLTEMAAVPYMDILQLWIQKGVINDPQNEFLVEDNEIITQKETPAGYSEGYWEKRYVIRREVTPCFLEKLVDKILRTGKYLNVIRQCGKKVTCPHSVQLRFSPDDHSYISVIEDAYHFASQNLLEVLLKENDLMGHILSVKRYLLLYQGDFIVQFMDACDDELAKPVDKVLPTKLESLLGLTLRLSSAKHDPYKDDVHCNLLTYDLHTEISKIFKRDGELTESFDLMGVECFAFECGVDWPISLVLDKIAIRKYQILFRQLFILKHVERQLCKIWKENSVCRNFLPHSAELYRSAFTLRQRMMNAIQNLEYYMMIEVIEPNWHIFLQKMEKVQNVDEVLFLHRDFQDTCIRNCLLSDEFRLSRIIYPLCKICLKFCDFIQVETALAPTDTFSQRVKTFDLEFSELVINLLSEINKVVVKYSSESFLNLVHRMNFNGFYNNQIDKNMGR